jgi:hypothetical protein
MRDRHVLETILMRRFPGAGGEQVAAAANAIMALIDRWTLDDRTRPPARAGLDKNFEEDHERGNSH